MTSANATIGIGMPSDLAIEQGAGEGILNWGRWLLLALLFFGIGLFLVYGPDEQTIIRCSAEWRELARGFLLPALLIFFIAEVGLIAVSVPVGIWLTVLGGFLFGTWLGTAVVNVASTIGAILAFLSARYLLVGAISRTAEHRPRLRHRLNAINAGFREHGAYYVLLVRLMPIIPFFVVNLGLGLTSLRLRDYWWATQIGMLPVTLVIANAGASLAAITSFQEVLSLRVLGALCLFPIVPFLLHQTLGKRLSRASQGS